jgi:Ser/Thr protein kinase RdoA (MazF antagonist)
MQEPSFYLDILSHFQLSGAVTAVSPIGRGLINDSFRADTDSSGYVLQRINHQIFQDVELLQRNVLLATNHIRAKLTAANERDIDRKVVTLIPAADGKTYYFDSSNYWRVLLLIPDSETVYTITADSSFEVGKAFGNFEYLLSDLTAELRETIPNFHNIEFRLQQLRDVVARDPCGLASSVRDIINEIERRSFEMCKSERLYRENKLPKRICHCDTKVDNMLFDKSGNVLCVIDLDTVMPSFVFSDFGDFLRSAANTGAEDSQNLDEVSFNMEIFTAFAKGYLQSAVRFLTDIEIENLPYAAKLLADMQTIRFLWDYVQGSTYYKIQYPEHNLVRTKAQLKLVESVEAHEAEMMKYIEDCVAAIKAQ